MRFTKLRLIGASTVNLPIIGATPVGPFVLKGADGLAPPERTVAYADTVEEGGIRQNVRAANREIVMRIGLQPDWNVGQTPGDLREVLYGMLTTKYDEQVKCQIMNGSTVVAQAKGDVSKLEASIFVADPEVQLTLECDHPHLLATAIGYQTPVRTVSGANTLIDISNDGTAKAGFWMGVTLQDLPTGGKIELSDDRATPAKMSIAGPWAVGDTFIVDTRAGSRGVWRIPSGSTTKASKLNDLAGDSPWLQLYGGDNRLVLNVDAFDWYGSAFGHTTAYWGV